MLANIYNLYVSYVHSNVYMCMYVGVLHCHIMLTFTMSSSVIVLASASVAI